MVLLNYRFDIGDVRYIEKGQKKLFIKKREEVFDFDFLYFIIRKI